MLQNYQTSSTTKRGVIQRIKKKNPKENGHITKWKVNCLNKAKNQFMTNE